MKIPCSGCDEQVPEKHISLIGDLASVRILSEGGASKVLYWCVHCTTALLTFMSARRRVKSG